MVQHIEQRNIGAQTPFMVALTLHALTKKWTDFFVRMCNVIVCRAHSFSGLSIGRGALNITMVGSPVETIYKVDSANF